MGWKKILIGYMIAAASLIITSSELAALDTTLENLDLSGTLRMRAWHTGSQVKVPDRFPATDDYSHVNYEDLFFRNRFSLNALPMLQIRAVFDIIAVLGKNDFALGNGNTNLVTRNVYAVLTPWENAELSVGLQPFSLNGGYIMARDASGAHYTQHLFNRAVRLYSGIVKAFDVADSAYGDNTEPPKYAGNNVYFIGSELNISSTFYCDLYYVFEHDRFVDIDDDNPPEIIITDGRRATLHWVGIHNKFLWRNFTFRAGGIINRGTLDLDDGTTREKTEVKAWLLEFEASYRDGNFQAGLVAEGASGNPNNPEAGNSFQDIKASHEFSYIVVDNYGGLAIRGSGESPWYGLYGAGLRAQHTFFNSVNFEMRLLHFRTARALEIDGRSSTRFGEEVDFRAEYIYQESLALFATAALFRPGTAYFALDSVRDNESGIIAEIMLGAQVTY